MANITYTDKDSNAPLGTPEREWRAVDANQVKTAVNSKADITYVDSQIAAASVGLFDDRGSYNASSNLFPSTGGSGTAGAILKGDLWTISVAGTLGGQVVNIGDTVRALIDTPGQTSGNWAIGEGNIGFVPQRVDAINSTGVAIQFDQPRTYGEPTAETGNITLNPANAQRGQVALIRHNNGTAPTFGTEFKRIGGTYATGQLNFIFCTYVSPSEILYSISQVQI